MLPENSAVVPISPLHDRKSFNCGKRSMNDFLVGCGLSEAFGATWVLVSEPHSHTILAYYTIWPDPQVLGGDGYDDHEIEATVITLERIAVDKRYQRRGIARFILARIILQTVTAAEAYAVDALHLYALDEDAKRYYMHLELGFAEASPGSRHLLLPVATMRKAINSE